MKIQNLLIKILGGPMPKKPESIDLDEFYRKKFAIVLGPMSERKRQILFATVGILALKNAPIRLETVTRYPDTSGNVVYVDFMSEEISPKELFKLIRKKPMVWNVESMEDLLIFKSNLPFIQEQAVIYR